MMKVVPSEHPESKIITQSGGLKRRSDLECSSPAFNKPARIQRVPANKNRFLDTAYGFRIIAYCFIHCFIQKLRSVSYVRGSPIRGNTLYQRQKPVKLTVCRFCPCCVKYLQILCFLNAELKHSRPDLVSKCLLISFSECSFHSNFQEYIRHVVVVV